MLGVKKLLFTMIGLGTLSTISAQDQNSSPYTRYGLGQLSSTTNSAFVGMGGAGVSILDENILNYNNPATYGSAKKYKPIFNIEITGKYSSLNTSSSSYSKTTAGLKNFALLLPVSKKTGIAFGLTPYSTTGYDVTSIEGDSIAYNYKGFGSINKFFLGAGQQIFNRGDSVKLSVGANVNFLFGTLERNITVEFSVNSYFNTRIVDKSILRGTTFDAALHYYQKINNKWAYQFGAKLDLGRDVTGYQDFYAYNYKLASSVETSKDTVSQFTDSEGYFSLPSGTSFGLSLIYKEKWTFSGQYQFLNWQDYKESFNGIENLEEELVQQTRVSLGMQYKPRTDKEALAINAGTLKRASYQLGGHFGKSPYFLEGTHLKDYGISFGVQLPLVNSGSFSMMNLGVDLGKMGTTDNGLIEDNYIKFNIGFSLSPGGYDRWFYKRKYN
jgi:hypothetical protein